MSLKEIQDVWAETKIRDLRICDGWFEDPERLNHVHTNTLRELGYGPELAASRDLVALENARRLLSGFLVKS